MGLAQAKDMTVAINEALDHLEKQAVKYKTRWRSKKRLPQDRRTQKKWNGQATQDSLPTAIGLSKKPPVPVMVHKFPAVAKSTEFIWFAPKKPSPCVP